MSTNEAKPTPGPWKYSFEGSDPSWAIVTGQGGAIIANVNSETGPDAVSAPAMRQMPADANARLIAEVGTVYHETGLTPRELAEQVKRQSIVLGTLVTLIDESDQWSDIASTSPLGEIVNAARAALPKPEPR